MCLIVCGVCLSGMCSHTMFVIVSGVQSCGLGSGLGSGLGPDLPTSLLVWGLISPPPFWCGAWSVLWSLVCSLLEAASLEAASLEADSLEADRARSLSTCCGQTPSFLIYDVTGHMDTGLVGLKDGSRVRLA